jgi:tetratricopeptide (TPR) repeat protein
MFGQTGSRGSFARFKRAVFCGLGSGAALALALTPAVGWRNAFLAGLERRDVRHLIKAITLVALIASTDGAGADEWSGCISPDLERIIVSCTKLIETPGIDAVRLGNAFSRRAYGYDRLGQYQRAIRDYDEAIRILPRYAAAINSLAIAYNNRAEAYLKLGNLSQGLLDAERAVQLVPREPHFYAMRGSISQSLGDQQGAIGDHDSAMALGGARWVQHYQCGLRLARLYPGPLDGILRPELRTALRICADKGGSCDPWSTDPECPDPVG